LGSPFFRLNRLFSNEDFLYPGKIGEMPYVISLLVLGLAVLAGSPWLLAHRAERKRRLHFVKMRRIRLRAR
jgi:hypothetical protein